MKLTKYQKARLLEHNWDVVSNKVDGKEQNCSWISVSPEDGKIFGEIIEHFGLTGDYEDFADGDDSKTGTDQDYMENHAMFPTSYRVHFRHCGNKHGAIRGLAFNRRANKIDEFLIPKGCFPDNISLSYRKGSNELFGKYKEHLIKSYIWG